MSDSGVKLLLNGGNTNIFQGVVVGNSTLTTATSNVGFGTTILDGVTTGNRNQGFGTAILDNLTTGSDNSGFGYNSLHLISSGLRNCAFGNDVLSTVATQNDNAAFGYNCINESANSARNCAFGSGVLATLNDAVNCVDNFCAGYNSLTLATAVERTVSIGSATGATASTAGECTLVGYGVASQGAAAPALVDLTGVGAWALHNVTTNASRLVGVGWSAMLSATTAARCVAVGNLSLSSITVSATGNDTTAIGDSSLSGATTAIQTTAIGSNAGGSETQYTDCTFVGYSADAANNLTNATAIGANALVTASNSVVLGNAANVGIGISAPTANLHIVSGGTTPALQIAGSGIVVPYRSTGSQVTSANKTDVIYQSLSTTPTITLPDATQCVVGQLIFIKNNSFQGGGNYLNLIPIGGQTIDGDTSVQIVGNHTGAILYTDASNWFIIASYGPSNRT